MIDNYMVSQQDFLATEYPINATQPTKEVPINVKSSVTTSGTRGAVLVLYIVLLAIFLLMTIYYGKELCKKTTNYKPTQTDDKERDSENNLDVV
jgi:hypothetical protein